MICLLFSAHLIPTSSTSGGRRGARNGKTVMLSSPPASHQTQRNHGSLSASGQQQNQPSKPFNAVHLAYEVKKLMYACD